MDKGGVVIEVSTPMFIILTGAIGLICGYMLGRLTR
jgi:hypothetical protein